MRKEISDMNVLSFYTKYRIIKYLSIFFILFGILFFQVVDAKFVDKGSDKKGFGGGKFSVTEYDKDNDWVDLSSRADLSQPGEFLSRIMFIGSKASVRSLEWKPNKPYSKELPNNLVRESIYDSGNVDMSGNVLLLHLNETSGNLQDSSGGASPGVKSGSLGYNTSGRFNSAVSFDGSSAYITVPKKNVQLTEDFTLALWLQISGGANKNRGIIEKLALTGKKYKGYALSMDASNKFVFSTASNSDSLTSITSNDSYIDSNWHYIVARKSQGILSLFIDGQPQNQTIQGQIMNSPGDLLLGNSLLSGNLYFSGKMDEVAIYNRALSPLEITSLYKRGALRLKFQIRTCNDPDCVGESFVGPQNLSNTFFEENDFNTVNFPSFDISSLPSNPYFQYRVLFESDDLSDSPALKEVAVDVTSPQVVDLKFDPVYGGTKLSDVARLDSVENLKLATEHGSITWQDTTDVASLDLDSNINISDKFVSLNINSLNNSFDTTSTVTLAVNSCSNYAIYSANGFYNTVDQLIANGQLCNENTQPSCTNIFCFNGVLSFSVPHFDGYGVGDGAPVAASTPEFSDITYLISLIISGWYISTRVLEKRNQA